MVISASLMSLLLLVNCGSLAGLSKEPRVMVEEATPLTLTTCMMVVTGLQSKLMLRGSNQVGLRLGQQSKYTDFQLTSVYELYSRDGASYICAYIKCVF